jgi:predicted nuclease with TOPRIM domain
MKRQILLLVTAIFLYSLSYGQVTKDSYEKAVDILNYQSVYYSLSVLSLTSGVTAKFKSNCNCENTPAFEKIKSSIPGTETKTIKISNKIQELKSQDVSAFNKSQALDFLLVTTFDQSKPLNDFKSQLEQKGKLQDYTSNIRQKLEGALQENNQVNTSNQKESESKLSDFDDRIRIIEKNQNSKEEKSGILGGLSDYLILLAIILGILGLLLALRKKNNYQDLLPKILESKRLRDFVQSQNSFNRNTQGNHSNTSEIKDLHSRIRDLETQIKKLNNQIYKLTEPAPIQTTSRSYQEVRQPESKIETLFLSTPNSDGSFNESSASNTYRDGASIYRLTKTGGVNAKFQIDEKETSIKLALQYPDKNIDPVCDAENAFNPKSTRISTIKMGEAELQNGKWIINSKAVIRYED